MKKRLLTFVLALLLPALAGCADSAAPAPSPAPEAMPEAAPEPTPFPVPEPYSPGLVLQGKYFAGSTSFLRAPRPEELTAEDLEGLSRRIAFLPKLKTLELTGCPETEALHALQAEHPELEIRYAFELLGVPVSTEDKTLILNGIRVKDVEALERELRFLPKLQKVEMCDCGVSDGEMDRLDKAFPGTRFIWKVYIMRNAVRTDEDNFSIYSAEKRWSWASNIDGFRYCRDMVCLDLGHQPAVHNVEFARELPKLKYLILADTTVQDLSPLAECKELVYLEMFQMNFVTDISPLLELTKLEDLNLCYMVSLSGDAAYEVLSQMTWLKRLWFCGNHMTQAQRDSLQELLPDCEMLLIAGPGSTAGSWRYGERYYEMRDMLGMYYATPEGNTQPTPKRNG